MRGLTRLRARITGRRVDLIVVTGFLAGFALVRASRVGESDQFWSARAGLENLSGEPLARPDSWSWAPIDGLWYQNSPLWNTMLGTAYQAAQYWGLFLLACSAIGLLLLLVARLAVVIGTSPLVAFLATLPILAAEFPFLSPRATVAAEIVILGSVLWATHWAERAGRHRVAANSLIVAAVGFTLSALGAWLHLAFLAWAPMMAVVWVVIWWLTPTLRGARLWAMSLAGSLGWLIGWLLMPYGVQTVIWRSEVVSGIGPGLILEWTSPFHPGVPPQYLYVTVITAATALGAAAWTGSRLRGGARDRPTRTLVALTLVAVPTAVAGFSSIRFFGVALPALAPVAAAAAPRLARRCRRLVAARWTHRSWLRARAAEYSTARFWRVVLVWTLALLTPLALLVVATNIEPPEQPLIDQLPSECQLFSESGLGSRTVLRRPDVQVWLDGRADFYGRAHLELTNRYLLGQQKEVVPPGTTCVLIDTDFNGPRLYERLNDSAEWRLVDAVGTVSLWVTS